ncbi:CoA-transferase family III-domain-containing protein [Lactarius indigo]|nr:CoA-transferase family III-domain-containing protein [Lactarius indigo]
MWRKKVGNNLASNGFANEAQLGYLDLQNSPQGLAISMSAGGRYEYMHRATAVTIEKQPLPSLLQENKRLKDELLKMEIRLACANSLIDTEDCGDVGVATGAPTAVTERNRKHQISLMHEANVYRYQEDLMNYHYERGVEEERRNAHDTLLGEYHNWDGQESVLCLKLVSSNLKTIGRQLLRAGSTQRLTLVSPSTIAPPVRAWESSTNASVSIDMCKEEGRILIQRLAECSDVVLENFKPGTLERWGLGSDKLRATNPGLIFTCISGYGQTGDGPWSSTP